MPGDDWQKFANLRAYYALMWGYPGKKLLFMGQEFAQRREWSESGPLDWHLLDAPAHEGVRRLVRDLNRLYREKPALHARDCEGEGFAWADRRRPGQFGLCLDTPGARRAADCGHRQYDPGDTERIIVCPLPRGRHLERDG